MSNSRILGVEAKILLTGIGYTEKQAEEFVSTFDVVIPLDLFKNEYTKAFHAAGFLGKWQAKEHYLNLTKGEIEAGIEKVSKKGKL